VTNTIKALVAIIITIATTLGLRAYQGHRFLTESSDFREAKVSFRFEDSLSDPRACRTFPLGQLILYSNGNFEFKKEDGGTLNGSFDLQRTSLSLGKLQRLDDLIKSGAELSHQTGFVVETQTPEYTWSATVDDFQRLSKEELVEFYMGNGNAALSDTQSNDIVGTLTLETISNLQPDDRAKIVVAIREVFAKIDISQLQESWPIARRRELFF
jgi:hypothetical protein